MRRAAAVRAGSPGTYERIWEIVRHIPKGTVATYGEVAAEAGFPGQARMVGYALHALPPGSGVPWQRVINAMGKISFPAGGESHLRQKRLLLKEGIVFRGDRIDRSRFGWLRKR